MDKLLQLLVSGAALGAVYSLLALGFVVVFRATEVVNFAHGGLLMVGTYFTARFRTVNEYPFVVALLLGIARRGRRRRSSSSGCSCGRSRPARSWPPPS